MTRRQSLAGLALGGTALLLDASVAGARDAARRPTAEVATNAGKVRGLDEGGIAVFRGIPYGADTRLRRFRAPVAAQGWTGVRDCFQFGPWSPQGARPEAGASPDTPAGKAVAALFGADVDKRFGEDCLVLDVYTPDASVRRKRPVMFWLHGGGFTSGAGGVINYDGKNLARFGDVVVVTVNHRVSAPGYLYLGWLHDDLADSGNAGQLDIILALQWVRDNIAAFGGDPHNVMIFGESGGGAKVSALLASPAAAGLFHKAGIQSGAGVKMVDKTDAVEVAERTIAALGIAKTDVRKLLAADMTAVSSAMAAVKLPTERRILGPVVDGRSLPAHPFDPAGPEISRDVPVIVGTNKDEQSLFMAFEPGFGTMSASDAKTRFERQLGANAAPAFELYRGRRPDDPPTYWVVSMATDRGMWINAVRLVERRAAQQAAPVYMYRLDWECPVANRALRAPHGIDVPLIFRNNDVGPWPNMIGSGADAVAVSAAMSRAWVNFARTGDPSSPALRWPAYSAADRPTLLFDKNSRVVADPEPDLRRFWSGLS